MTNEILSVKIVANATVAFATIFVVRGVVFVNNYAEDKYFEIANTELTVAELKYDVAFKKLKMLCADGVAVPQMQIYKSYETV